MCVCVCVCVCVREREWGGGGGGDCSVCECAQKPYVVPNKVHIYPDRRGVDM